MIKQYVFFRHFVNVAYSSAILLPHLLLKNAPAVYGGTRIYLLDPLMILSCIGYDLCFTDKQLNLAFSTFRSIGTVDDIFINCQTVIPSNRSRRRIGWVRFSHHFTCRFYDIFTFPNHCKDWSRSNKVDKVIEKRTFFMFSV